MSERAGFQGGEGASAESGLSAREKLRLTLAVAVGALVALFAALNLDEAEVNWVFGTWSTPMIVVIAVSAIAGAILDRVGQAFLRRRRQRRHQG